MTSLTRGKRARWRPKAKGPNRTAVGTHAGFTDADLSIETKENRLTILGEKQNNDEENTGDVLYQGIAARTFERSFELADYVKVKGASLENGLLHVDLVREIPEAMKPRAIPITSTSKLLEVKPTKVAA